MFPPINAHPYPCKNNWFCRPSVNGLLQPANHCGHPIASNNQKLFLLFIFSSESGQLKNKCIPVFCIELGSRLLLRRRSYTNNRDHQENRNFSVRQVVFGVVCQLPTDQAPIISRSSDVL